MKNQIKSFKQLAEKISSIDFTNQDGNTFTNDVWKLSFSFSASESLVEKTPVNVVMHLRHKNTHVCSWGNEDHKSTVEIIKLFHAISRRTRTAQRKSEEKQQKESFLAFEMLEITL